MDYKFKHGDKVRVVRLNSQCTAQNSSRIKVGDVFTIEILYHLIVLILVQLSMKFR